MNELKLLRDAVPMDEVKRVLVIKLRHHGDVLLSAPVFSALKAQAPHVEIDALVYADTAEMLSLHPAISQLHVIDRKWKKLGVLGQLRAEFGLFQALKGRRYDLVIHLTEHWRGAWLTRLLGARWSAGCTRVDAGRLWHRSFTHLYKVSGSLPRHTVERNLDALRRLGVWPTPEQRRVLLVPGEQAEMAVAAHLERLGLAEGRYIQIHPTSRWYFKCWPVERMVSLIEQLQAQGWPILLTAAPSAQEMQMVEAIQSRLAHPALSLAGELSLKELAAVTRHARLFVGVDSAPMHIAAAVDTPTVVLFGPSGEKQWGPWGVRSRVITSDHSCRPCGLDGCGSGKVSDCLVAIPAETVLEAINALLES